MRNLFAKDRELAEQRIEELVEKLAAEGVCRCCTNAALLTVAASRHPMTHGSKETIATMAAYCEGYVTDGVDGDATVCISKEDGQYLTSH
jgi:hypothetical protein